jgi:DNA-binding GntR family transcriptional regulator
MVRIFPVSDAEEAIPKASSAAEAYEEVLLRLRSGRISPDDKIVDTSLAAELNMSRMPAREALLRLVSEGYLVGSTRGFRLPTLSEEDIFEIFEIRKQLEPRAAALASVRLSATQRAELEAAVEDARAGHAAADPMLMFDAQLRFRMAWIEAVPNKRMVTILSRFFDQVNAVRIATLHDRETREVSLALVEELLVAFLKGDSLLVMEQMHSFIEAAQRRFTDLNRAKLPRPKRKMS